MFPSRSSFYIVALALCIAVTTSALPVIEKRTDHTGRGTWYHTGGSPGNCGFQDSDDKPVIAISTKRYGDGENCNQWIQITNNANGNVAYGQTRDSCPGCDEADLDLSPSLFQELGNLDDGVLDITWHFQAKDWTP